MLASDIRSAAMAFDCQAAGEQQKCAASSASMTGLPCSHRVRLLSFQFALGEVRHIWLQGMNLATRSSGARPPTVLCPGELLRSVYEPLGSMRGELAGAKFLKRFGAATVWTPVSFAAPARKLVISLFAMLVTTTGLSGVAAATSANPIGALESVQATAFSNTVVINGWAVDLEMRSQPTNVQLTVDGANFGALRPAALPRPDVTKTYSASGGHGFSFTVTLPTGNHTVCLTARTYSAGTSASLGCFAFQGYPPATQAQMLEIAKTIDPRGTLTWKWTSLPTGSSGRAEPWNGTILLASGNTTRYLRAVMLHEWSHVLQYRAFAAADPWWDAVQAFNALQGHATDRQNYDGVEHGADCIAAALGADHLGYGCPAALRVYGARIARGQLMNHPDGRLESTKISGKIATVNGWALDPSNPTTASTIQVTDNGRAVTGWVRTTLNRSDVNTALGVTGAHGFQLQVSLPIGTHRLCVSAAAVTAGRPAAPVGSCATVTAT